MSASPSTIWRALICRHHFGRQSPPSDRRSVCLQHPAKGPFRISERQGASVQLWTYRTSFRSALFTGYRPSARRQSIFWASCWIVGAGICQSAAKWLNTSPGLPWAAIWPRAAPTQRRRLRTNRQFHWWQWRQSSLWSGPAIGKNSPAAKGSILTGRIIHNQNSRISHNPWHSQPLDLTTERLSDANSAVQSAPFAGNFFNPFLNQSFSHSLINQVKGDFYRQPCLPTWLSCPAGFCSSNSFVAL